MLVRWTRHRSALAGYGPFNNCEPDQRNRGHRGCNLCRGPDQLLSPAQTDAMLELVRSFQSPAFAKALRSVIELPKNPSAKKIAGILGPDGEDLLAHLTATWETIGMLLFHDELTIDLVDGFFSGPILISWGKLGSYIDEMRRRYDRNTWFEWFQWLAERMTERESKTPAVPAYIAQRNWRPRRD